MASIREEYRKFRVKSELGRKQREAEIRQVSAESIAEKQRRISGQGAVANKEQVQALEDELQRLRNELVDKEEVGAAGEERAAELRKGHFPPLYLVYTTSLYACF